jgi:poly(3-hydroxybutyrate) depolymerase
MAGAPAMGGAAGMSTGAGGGSAGAPPAGDITAVVKTAGCGMAPPAAFQPGKTSGSQTIMTMGTKPANCADSNCNPWSYNREYFVTLPAGYDNTKAYPLVFEGPGCGSNGTAVYPLTGPAQGNAQNANNTVIRVGLTPPPNAIGHATNPNQGCFDDKEGDSSVDWVFYENLYDKLAGQLCFDKNRVFSTGNSSGAWFSNEVGCKYAGDPMRPIRGVMPNTGGLPTDPKFVPTCTKKPMAGMWVGETNDPDNPFAGNVVAINRAISVNGCTGGDWPASPTADYPVSGNSMVCKQLTGCPVRYPLVVCLIVGNQHQGHDNITNPGFSKFLQFFSTPPQITP